MSKPNKRWSPNHSLKKWYIRPEQNSGQERGDESEAMFLRMTEELIRSNEIPWAKAVLKASSSDDLLKGVDFRIRSVAINRGGSTCEFSLLIDVKSSLQGARKTDNRRGPGVYWLVVYPGMPERELRNVLYMLFMKEIKRLRETNPLA